MSGKKGGAAELIFNRVMPKIYGIGAAIVILGALFKIQHWEGAGAMLVTGLITEAVIFFLSAFQPVAAEPDWTRVYPELSDDYEGELPTRSNAAPQTLPKGIDKLGEVITTDLVDRVGKGMQNLAENVNKMSKIGDATVATGEYAQNVKLASNSLVELNKSYATTVSAMSEMANASQDAKAYHAQVQVITKNLSALNAVYELEMQDAQKHLKSMNAFYGNLAIAMDNMAEASKDTQQFKEQLSGLTNNLTSLNKIYGNMLTAMRG